VLNALWRSPSAPLSGGSKDRSFLAGLRAWSVRAIPFRWVFEQRIFTADPLGWFHQRFGGFSTDMRLRSQAPAIVVPGLASQRASEGAELLDGRHLLVPPGLGGSQAAKITSPSHRSSQRLSRVDHVRSPHARIVALWWPQNDVRDAALRPAPRGPAIRWPTPLGRVGGRFHALPE